MCETYLSDVHMNTVPEITNSHCETVLSRFPYLTLNRKKSTVEEYDEDGDILVQRDVYTVIVLEHNMATPLSTVGLQVWRGALLLCDYLIFGKNDILKGENIIELGAGTGICSLVAANYAKRVITTDYDSDVLSQCQRNILRNKQSNQGEILVRRLDWLKPLNSQIDDSSWKLHLEEFKLTDTIIAADVIYDDDLTDAFFEALKSLIIKCPIKLILISLEKRLNFTLNDLDVNSPAYNHFHNLLMKTWNTKVQSIPIDFPQFFQYQRIPQLELWAVRPDL